VRSPRSEPFTGLRAVLFDVLHTLVDDSGFPKVHMRRLLEDDGVAIDPDRFEMIYHEVTTREYDWETAAREAPFRSIRDRHEARVAAIYEQLDLVGLRDVETDTRLLWERISTSRLYPDVAEVLPEIARRGYRLALVSNADEDDPVLRVLMEADLPFRFDAVITSQGAGAYKPAPRIFEHALWRLELDPGEVLMVGDNAASDVLGGSRAGMRVVWLNRRGKEYPADYPEPDATLSDLRGLLPLLPDLRPA
jgi:2-haloacid dehalogenase